MTYPGKRLVLIFYNNNGIELKNKQLDLLKKDSSGISNRDIEVSTYEITAEKTEVKRWNISSSKPFTFLLVGKDGGEKLRSDSIINLEQLFQTIDAMPMRQSEMKKDN